MTVYAKDAIYECAFAIGDEVCLKLRPAWDGGPIGMVTAIRVYPGGVSYSVTWADTRQEMGHYEIELVPADEKQA